MQTYQSHKKVQAAAIHSIVSKASDGSGTLLVYEEPGAPIPVDVAVMPGFFNRGTPNPGDYLVVYPASDNVPSYQSWSPKEVFEKGYESLAKPPALISDEELGQRMARLPGQRVTKEYIEGRVKSVAYFQIGPTVTVCQITLDNGYSVRGEAACVDPRNFDADIGRKYAYEDGFKKLWPLFGFLLAEKRMREA